MNKALRNMLSMLVFLSLAASALQVPLAADEPTVEQAQAQWIPWSGYWWPLYAGGLLGPLEKYDQITGRKAAQWEQTHYPITQGGATLAWILSWLGRLDSHGT